MTQRSRNIILNRLKYTKTREEDTLPSPGFHFLKTYNQPLIKTFEEKLNAVSGEFHYCQSIAKFSTALSNILKEKGLNQVVCFEESIKNIIPQNINTTTIIDDSIEVSITGCELLVAQTGSVMVSSYQTKSRKTFSYPPIHIVIAFKNQLVAQLEEGLNILSEKYRNQMPSQITTITGPSRTADIEKTLVLGAHGPKELIVFVIDNTL